MSYFEGLAILAAINIVVAMGLYIQMSTGQLSAGHAAFMGIGAYTAAVAAVRFDVPFVPTLLLSGLMGGLIATGFARLVLRLSHWFMAVVTLAFGEALVVVILNARALGGAVGYSGIPLRTTLVSSLVVLGACLAFVVWLERSPLGPMYQAVKEDEQTAEALGIHARRIRVVAFGLGGALAGLGGGLFAQYLGLIEPTDLGFDRSLSYLLFVALGGTATVWGTVVSTIVLGLLPELLRFSASDRFLLYGIVIILIMIVRPQGVLSHSPWEAVRRIRGRVHAAQR